MHRDMRRRTKNVPSKFAPPPTPFQKEAKIPDMEPPEWMLSDAVRRYAANEQDTVPGFKDYLAKELLKDQEELTRKNFVLEFKAWLRGISRYNYDRNVTPWGTSHLMHLPGVNEMFDAELDQYYKFKSALLKLATWGPTNLDDAYLYYKYIVLPLWMARVDPTRTCKWFDHDGRQMFLDHCSYVPNMVMNEKGLDEHSDIEAQDDRYALNALPVELARHEKINKIETGVRGPYDPERYIGDYASKIVAFMKSYDDTGKNTQEDLQAVADTFNKRLSLLRRGRVLHYTKHTPSPGGIKSREEYITTQATWLRDVREKLERAENIKYFKKFKNTLKMGDVLRMVYLPPQMIPYTGPYINNEWVPQNLATQMMPIGSATTIMNNPIPLSGAVGPDATATGTQAPDAPPPPVQVTVPPVVTALLQSVPRSTGVKLDVPWDTDRTVQYNVDMAVDKLRDNIYGQYETAMAMIQRFDDYTRWMDQPGAADDERVARARQEYIKRRNKTVQKIQAACTEAKLKLAEDKKAVLDAALTHDITDIAAAYFERQNIQVRDGYGNFQTALVAYAKEHEDDTHTVDRYTLTVPEMVSVLVNGEGTTITYSEEADEMITERQFQIRVTDVDSVEVNKRLAINLATGAEIERAFLPWANEYYDLLIRPVRDGAKRHVEEGAEETDFQSYVTGVDTIVKNVTRYGDEAVDVASTPAYEAYRRDVVPIYRDMIAHAMFTADRLLLTDKEHSAVQRTYDAMFRMIQFENMRMAEATMRVNSATANPDEWDDGRAVRAAVAASKGVIDTLGSISTVVNGTLASAALAIGESIRELREHGVDPGPLVEEYNTLVELLNDSDDPKEANARLWNYDQAQADETGREFRRLVRDGELARQTIELDNAQQYLTISRDWQLTQLRIMLQLNTPQGGLLDPRTSALMEGQRRAHAILTGLPAPAYSSIQFVADGDNSAPPRPSVPAPLFGLPDDDDGRVADASDDEAQRFVVQQQLALPIPDFQAPPPPPPPGQPRNAATRLGGKSKRGKLDDPDPVLPGTSAPPAPPTPAASIFDQIKQRPQLKRANDRPVPDAQLAAQSARDAPSIVDVIKSGGVKLKPAADRVMAIPPASVLAKTEKPKNNSLLSVLARQLNTRFAKARGDEEDNGAWDDDRDDGRAAPVATTTTTATPEPEPVPEPEPEPAPVDPVTDATTTTASNMGARMSVPKRDEAEYEEWRRKTLKDLMRTVNVTQEEVERYEAATAWSIDTARDILTGADGQERVWEVLVADLRPFGTKPDDLVQAGKRVPAVLRLLALQDPVSLRLFDLSNPTEEQNGPIAKTSYIIGPMATETPYISLAVTKSDSSAVPETMDVYTPIAARVVANAAGIRLPERLRDRQYRGRDTPFDWTVMDELLRMNKSQADVQRGLDPDVPVSEASRNSYRTLTTDGLGELISYRIPPSILMHVLYRLKHGRGYDDYDTSVPAIVSRILRRYTDPDLQFAKIPDINLHAARAAPNTRDAFKLSRFDVRVGNAVNPGDNQYDIGYISSDNRSMTGISIAVRTLAAMESTLTPDLDKLLTLEQLFLYNTILDAVPEATTMNDVYRELMRLVDPLENRRVRQRVRAMMKKILAAIRKRGGAGNTMIQFDYTLSDTMTAI